MRSLTLRPGHSLPSFRWFRRWASELGFPAALPSKLRGVWLLPRWDCLPLNTSAFAGRTLRVLSPGAHSPLARQGRARRPAHRAAGARHDHHDSRSRRLASSLHPAGGLTQPNPFTTLGPVLPSGCSRPHPQKVRRPSVAARRARTACLPSYLQSPKRSLACRESVGRRLPLSGMRFWRRTAPQRGLARLIRRIRSRSSVLIAGRPSRR